MFSKIERMINLRTTKKALRVALCYRLTHSDTEVFGKHIPSIVENIKVDPGYLSEKYELKNLYVNLVVDSRTIASDIYSLLSKFGFRCDLSVTTAEDLKQEVVSDEIYRYWLESLKADSQPIFDKLKGMPDIDAIALTTKMADQLVSLERLRDRVEEVIEQYDLDRWNEEMALKLAPSTSPSVVQPSLEADFATTAFNALKADLNSYFDD